MKITKEQFHAYQKVQFRGLWNMFDSQAREATGLPREVYVAILTQYDELQKEYGDLDG